MNCKKIVLLLCGAMLWSAAAGRPAEPFRGNYERGIELFRAGHYAAARVEFEAARRDPAAGDGSFAEEVDYYLTLCAVEAGRADASERLAAFLARYPHTLHAGEVLLALGDACLAQGRYAEALAQYDRLDPARLPAAGRAEYHFDRGYALFLSGDNTGALAEFGLVGSDHAFGPSATYYTAYIEYRAGELDAARARFLTLASDRNYGPIVPFYLLHIDFEQERYRQVVQEGPALLSRAVGERRAEILRLTGESFYRLENYPEALRYLDAYAAEKGSLTREEHYLVGYSAYMTGDFEKATGHLGRVAVGEDQLAQNAAFHIGSAGLRSGDKQRALQAFSLAMRLGADRAVQEEAMFNYAKLEYELGGGSFSPSIETINRFLAEFPDSPNRDEARRYLTAAYLNSKNYAAAYAAVTRIPNPDDETRAALQKIAYYRGLELFADGDLAGAAAMFDVAAANRFSARYNALTKFWQAETHYRRGEYVRAVPLYQDYIVLSPAGERENAAARYGLAYSYFNLRNLPEARRWFDDFLAAGPATPALEADALTRLGDLDYLGRNYTAAIGRYERAAALGTPEADYARFQRAIALGLSRGPAAKTDALRRIVAGGGDWADEALYELGSTYTRGEQFGEAASTLGDFIRKYPDSPRLPDALLDLGLIHQNTGREAEAMRYYKQVVERDPASPQARDAMLGIRNLYVDGGDLPGYFAWAEGAGMETDVGAVERDSLTFNVAERIHLSGDTRRSLPLMQSYLSQFPQGAYVAGANYYLAESLAGQGETAAALEGFERVAAMPAGPFTLNALQKAAALNFERENYRAAADRYLRLSRTATARGGVEAALSGYIRSVAELGDPALTHEAAETVSASPMATDETRQLVRFALGRAYLAEERYDEALEAFRAAAALKTAHGSEAQYRVAELLVRAGRDTEAEAAIMTFSAASSHQYWLGKSFLLLGDIYHRRGDDFQAKATWQSIVDGYADPSDGIVDEAKNKLNAIR